jgi:hypothetical protein
VIRDVCPSLARLAEQLQEAYRQRNDSSVGNGDNQSELLLRAEDDLKRAHRLIAQHRVTCHQCKSSEQHRMVSEPGEVISINRLPGGPQ